MGWTLLKKIRAIITGATGMVGEGVLRECLSNADVEQVLIINRKPSGISHPKLKEIIHGDFFDLTPIENELAGYNACYFCLGVSSVGMKEEEYRRVTYDLTLGVATLLSRINADMVFCYVSGASTDSTEQGKSMWARVKGKTENDLLKLPFRRAYLFRPGYMHPTKGALYTQKYYYAFSWLYPLLRRLFPKHVITLRELGIAMIRSVNIDYPKSVLEVKDIIDISRK
ncbi:NAD-dependent epimerase/dehydratase family protein [Cohnella herbarum]|uniref:NAD-dependent epimerase/dehydratase family protein n=1 Tax=Cohnella herbarum TaxID=2728023 RepID=A0A7Z2ZKM0_9BACL|nr:NAD-dependent epimerase/dehydratase family protein [Cohnella herbarum]QJD83108.1 NAD-dependent epimerase/dehydratase family protein [Cohnella herbarum]